MEIMETMTNNETIEVAEEIVTAVPGKGLKVAGGIGLAVLACGAAYKFVIKPAIAKHKAKKEQALYDTEDEKVVTVDYTEIQ